MTVMTDQHILVKALDTTHPGRPEYTFTLECPGRPHCEGYTECRDRHEVDGRDADGEDPFDCSPDAPWESKEQFEFHGLLHTWHDGFGWTVPFAGCPVRSHPYFADQARDVLFEQMPGRYVVDDYWDEDDMSLKLVGPEGGDVA